MVQPPRQEPVPEYRVLDSRGRPIGRVIDPVGPIRMSPGGETVLLVR